MESSTKLTWWKTILYCLAFLAIFFGVAIISDLITQWITHLSLRFFIREIILRLPLSLYLMHLFAQKVIKLKSSTFYLSKLKKSVLGWVITGVLISSIFLSVLLLFNSIVYEYNGNQIKSEWLIYYLVSTAAMAINGGFIEETLFRGYIMGLLKEKWNLKVAVLIPSAIFGVMHLTMLETFNIVDVMLLFVGGSLVGIMFSLIVIKAKSVWAASLVHFIWNLFFAGRILKISDLPIEEINSIFAVHLKNDHVLFNGGSFGVEVSGIAIAFYALISLILIWRIKK